MSWAFIAMAGSAALALHLLRADTAGSLGPMTAAAVVLAVNGRVTPSGDVGVFGLEGAEAEAAVDIAPLGVALAGALFLAWMFLRSLRAAGAVIRAGELAARAGAVAALFLGILAGLCWAGNDTMTIDGSSLGLDDVPGGELPDGIADQLPEGLGDLGGGLPGRMADLAEAGATVGFSVDAAASLLGGAAWVAGVLLIALLASRRTPLPARWEGVHRVVRPAVSAVFAVLVLSVVAGLAAAAYAASGDENPARIAGAALLGAPNGVWLGLLLGLFVPWDGDATGQLVQFLPDPLDRLLGNGSEEPMTVGRLAELDERVRLLAVAAALAMLCAGVLTAARTPRGDGGAPGFAGRCGLRLAVATALALPLLVWLTDVSAGASLSVFGFDAFGAGIELHGELPTALLLGGAWGAGAGALGALLACATGAAGRRYAGPPGGDRAAEGPRAGADTAPARGPYNPSPLYPPPNDATNPYLRPPPGAYPTAPDIREGYGSGASDSPHTAPTVGGLPRPPPRVLGPWPPPDPPEEEGPPPPGRPRRR